MKQKMMELKSVLIKFISKHKNEGSDILIEFFKLIEEQKNNMNPRFVADVLDVIFSVFLVVGYDVVGLNELEYEEEEKKEEQQNNNNNVQ